MAAWLVYGMFLDRETAYIAFVDAGQRPPADAVKFEMRPSEEAGLLAGEIGVSELARRYPTPPRQADPYPPRMLDLRTGHAT